MKKIFYMAAALIAIAVSPACERQPEFLEVTELGCEKTEAVADAAGGSVAFDVIASGEVTASVVEGADWASVSLARWTGDSELGISFGANPSVERKATILLVSGARELRLTVIQNGAESTAFHFAERNVTVPFESGACSAQFETDIPAQEISGTVVYPDGGDWIEQPLSRVNPDGTFIYAVRENLGAEPRTAIIELSATDNVGRELTARLYVTQSVRGEVETVPLSVEGLRSLSIENGDIDIDGVILKPYALTGRVISDNSEGNAAPNSNLSSIIQDLTPAARTVYLQSEGDGLCCGVKLIFDSADALSPERYDLATISLKGRRLIRHDAPEHYTVSGLKAYDIMASAAGSASDVQQRIKTVNELCDSDINTLLTLSGCEIPISKGAFVPIDNSRSSIMNKYPMPLIDRSGSTIYLLTNTTASWARDGEGLPQGSGNVTGIIVNETCDNYEWDSAAAAADTRLPDYVTGLGNIGRYQIRPQHRSDIALDGEPFSKVLCEWTCYADVLDKPGFSYSKSDMKAISPSQDWSSPGPLSGSASGVVPQADGPAWFGAYWFSGSHSDPKLDDFYWQMEFSTADLTEANAPVSVQIAAFNTVGADVGAPRYWWLKYSTDGETWTAISADSVSGDSPQYTAIGEQWTYTVPDYPKNGSYRQYHCPGAKNMSFTLPVTSDLFGKDKVYVRLMPAKDASGYDGLLPISYDGAGIQNVKRSCLSYAAVRCNR